MWGMEKTGRPSSFKVEYIKQAEKLCALGATDQDLADFFGVHVATLHRWKHDHEGFCDALKSGKGIADERVERSLYAKAIGYSFDAVKVFQHEGKPVYAPYREHIPPSDTACIFWLKNRRPDLWRDRVQNEHTGPNGGAIVQRIERVIVDPKDG